jgi:tetraacyldisaccharide 4'-kinase
MVDPSRHDAGAVGDEPLMMSAHVGVVVASDRIEGVALARSRRASVILMDDGFQNPTVAKDTSLVVIDSDRGLGNGEVFPAGPLRAPLLPQLERTDALVVVGVGTASKAIAEKVVAAGGQVFSARLKPDAASLAQLEGKRILAFAGIGDPARFFRTLRASGLNVVGERAFADHHPFSQREIDALLADAKRDGLVLVTTQKDLARLRRGAEAEDFARNVVAFAITLEVEDKARLRKFLSERLFSARQRKFGAPG